MITIYKPYRIFPVKLLPFSTLSLQLDYYKKAIKRTFVFYFEKNKTNCQGKE